MISQPNSRRGSSGTLHRPRIDRSGQVNFPNDFGKKLEALMGGMGSGRQWYWGAKDTVGNYHTIDVRQLQRDDLLAPGRTFDLRWSRGEEVLASIRVRTEMDRVILDYRQRSRASDWQQVSYPVCLDWTSCHLGGRRPWFLCPAQGCERRVAILYGGSIFACRECHSLAYPSQRESEGDRAIRRADTIRERLGWPRGMLNGATGKPKGMHWQTFERLCKQHDEYVLCTLRDMDIRISRMQTAAPL